MRSTVNNLLSSARDPDAELDYTYQQLQDQLRGVENGIVDVVAERKRLEQERDRLSGEIENHNDQARRAVQNGNDDLARTALERKKRKHKRVQRIDEQLEELESAIEDLKAKRDELEQRTRAFRTEKEVIKARRKAAQAGADIADRTATADTSDRSVDRAEDATDQASARAAAIEELREEGVFEDQLTGSDQLDEELESVQDERTVENELETIKSQMDDEDDEDEDGS